MGEKWQFKLVDKKAEEQTPENTISEKETKKLEPNEISTSLVSILKKKIDFGDSSVSNMLKEGRLDGDDSFSVEVDMSLISSFDTTVNPEEVRKSFEIKGKLSELFTDLENGMGDKFTDLDSEKLFNLYNVDIIVHVFDKKEIEPSETTPLKYSNGVKIVEGKI